MLSRVNRITRAADFRAVVRTGRRLSSPNTVVYLSRRADAGPTRFGFIVSKAVGNSVVRHRVTRQLRAVGFELLSGMPSGADVIVRALPASIDARWEALRDELESAMRKGGVLDVIGGGA